MMEIDLAIIHAPRKIDYIGLVIDNLQEEFPGIQPHVFCEPGSEWFDGGYRVIKHVNYVTYGPFFNWLQAILLFQNSLNPWILICEDDIQWIQGSGKIFLDYLEKCTERNEKESNNIDNIGLVSGYCSKKNANPSSLGFGIAKVSPYGWCGALALAIPTHTITTIVNHTYALTEVRGVHLDNKIGKIMLNLKKKLIIHTPTLVHHLGNVHSTLVPEGHPKLLEDIRYPYL